MSGFEGGAGCSVDHESARIWPARASVESRCRRALARVAMSPLPACPLEIVRLEDLGVEGHSSTMMATALEDEFSISLDEATLAPDVLVARVVDLICSRLEHGGGATAGAARPRPQWQAGYALTNGIRLHYVSAGDGPLVLLCHGFPEFWYSWRWQLASLADRWRVVAVDLRGYHLSDKPQDGYDVKTLAADLAGLVDTLGARAAVIVGHDVGGMLAWQFALDYPRLTRGVVSLNTPFLSRPPVPYSRFLRMTPLAQYIVALQQPGAEAAIEGDVSQFVKTVFRTLACKRHTFPAAVLRRYAKALAPRGAVASTLAYYRNLDRSWELTADDTCRRIAAPALMLAADADPIFPAALSLGIHRLVPNACRRIIPWCGHWTQQEQPRLVNAWLRRFLCEVAPPGRVV